MPNKKIDNPYLQSKLLWNDLYGSVEEKLRKTQLMLFIMVAALTLSTIGILILATHAKIQPYVTVLHGNEALTLSKFSEPSAEKLKPKLASLLSQTFIKKLRSHTLDDSVNQDNYITALAMTSGAATHVTKNYHQLNTRKLRQVQITSLILRSPRLIDIRWIETTRDPHSGITLSTLPFSAELTFQFTKPVNNKIISEHNPLSFFITSLAWSQDHA